MKRLAWLSLSAALALPATAHAQTKEKDVAKAEVLFNEGVKLLGQKKYAEACDMLEESRKYANGLGVTLYLADCQEHNARPVAALALFRDAEKLAAARKDARQQVAHERVAQLEKSVPRILLRVAPEVAAARQQIILDGRKLEASEVAQPIVVEPGPHKIRSMSDDGASWESEIVAALGGTSGLDIPLLKPAHLPAVVDVSAPVPATAPTAVPPPPMPTTAPAPDSGGAGASTGSTQRTIGLVAAGAGVVGLGVGAVFGLSAKSKQSDSNANGHCNAADACDGTGLALRQDALGAATLSSVFFVVGAVAVAGGAVLYLTAPKGDKRSGLAVAPSLGAGHAGLFAQGSF